MTTMTIININPPYIKLEQFLKFAALVSTGGEAKRLIQGGHVFVNGEICRLRGKKLFGGEEVYIDTAASRFKVAVNP